MRLSRFCSALLTPALVGAVVGLSACKAPGSEASARTAVGLPAVRADAAVAIPELIVLNRGCMGTKCELKIFHHDRARAERAAERAFAEVDRIEALMTDWRESSEVSRINAAAGTSAVKVSADTLTVIRKGLWLGTLTGGAFDITVGVFRGLWKFDEDNDGTLPRKKDVKARLALVNQKDVVIDETASTVMLRRRGQRLTLGGIAKGYAVDAAVKVIREMGIFDFIMQAGGDLFASGRRGDRQWMVGVRDPRGPRDQIIYKLSLTDSAFNTSGDYERFVIKDGKRYHHILDARTGFPSGLTRSVTLLAKTAFEADLLDTALFVMGPKKAMAYVEQTGGLAAVIVDTDNHVLVSTGFPATLIKVGEPTPGI